MNWFELEGVALAPGEDPAKLHSLAARALGVGEETLGAVDITRRSVDARKKGHVLIRHTLHVQTSARVAEKVKAKRLASPNATLPIVPKVKRDATVLIIGAGPGGLFAALRLSEAGLKPVIVDRGKAVEPRAQDVQRFKRQRVLDSESNFCFGEGGAGTWSDGKLTTRTGDERIAAVFRHIVDLGGPPEILIDGKPHLGTNRLVKMLRALRAHLIGEGVLFRFQTRIDSLAIKDGQVYGAKTNDGDTIDAEHTILAPGHSARDVFAYLCEVGVQLEQKPFAVGYRVEHPQEWLNEWQYGKGDFLEHLPAADYRLTANLKIETQDRGVYSFCMCPGGVIVPTATEPGGVCVNGMSHASRSSPWANSALVVTVDPKDFAWGGKPKHPLLAGVEFQKRAEELAYAKGGSTFRAPAQRVADFVQNKSSEDIAFSSFRPGVVAGSLDGLYPEFVNNALRVALKQWENRMRGFVSNQAHLIGVETRTSSPLRVTRGDNGQSLSHQRLYPVGEGAGYAGGIVSAAVDGIRAADAIIAQLQ